MRINLVLGYGLGYLCRAMRSLIVPVFIVLDPGLSSVQILHVEGVLAPKFRKLIVQVLDHEWVDVLRRLRGNETDAELACYFSRDDRFSPRAVKRPFDAMERERRGAHAAHQRGRLVFRNRNLGTRGKFHVLEVVVKVLVELPKVRDEQKGGWSAAVRADGWKENVPFLFVGWRHHLVNAGNENVALRIDELAHESDEIGHGFVHHAAKYA